MPRIAKRYGLFVVAAFALVYAVYSLTDVASWISVLHSASLELQHHPVRAPPRDSFRRWRLIPNHFTVVGLAQLPNGPAADIPHVQHDFSTYSESQARLQERLRRRDAVKEAFVHTWHGYKKRAWLHDELKPITGGHHDPFGYWATTLVDSIDTIWIMDLEQEFHLALAALKQIDFTSVSLVQMNTFETTIRYLGGLLGAHDITLGKHPALLQKAIELGEFLYHAFDTPNKMPIQRWDWHVAEVGEQAQDAPEAALLAELGSLTLEFTRLTQLTNDPKYFDAVQRISDMFAAQQNDSRIPGLWPVSVYPAKQDVHSDTTFTLGGRADSAYEYLPKQYLLLNGRLDSYKDMYLNAIAAAKKYLAFEPLMPLQNANDKPAGSTKSSSASAYNFSPDYSNPLLLGTARIDDSAAEPITVDSESQHLACYAGGMAALGARIFKPFQTTEQNDEDMDVAKRLTAGCVWAYRNTKTGIAPELFHAAPCRRGRAAISSGYEFDWLGGKPNDCRWDRDRWLKQVRSQHLSTHPEDAAQTALLESEDPDRWEHLVRERRLPEGFTDVTDPRYMLRPEAIESLFVLWRVTGDPKYQDQAWDMFQAITNLTRTKHGFAGLADVTVPPEYDKKGHTRPVMLIDSMQSFWTAQTLKYFYLIFADPDLVSLDEFVLNTEAHPLRYRWSGPPPGFRKQGSPGAGSLG